MWELYVVITNIQRNKEQSLYLLCLYVLLSSTMLVMRDEEGKILTASNMFYNNIKQVGHHCNERLVVMLQFPFFQSNNALVPEPIVCEQTEEGAEDTLGLKALYEDF